MGGGKDKHDEDERGLFSNLAGYAVSHGTGSHGAHYPPPGAYPPGPGYPSAPGYPPQGGYPTAGYPPAGYPPSGYPPSGYPSAGYPPSGGYPSGGYPPQGYPPQQHGIIPSFLFVFIKSVNQQMIVIRLYDS